jgi:hypothetical protein
MTMKLHLFYSFLVHTVILSCLLTLPTFKSSIHLKSFVNYVVYLRNEEGKIVGKPPAAYKVKKSVIVHPHPNPPPSRGRELIRSAGKYSPSPGGRGLGGGGAELLQKSEARLRGRAKDAKTVLKTKEVDVKENTKPLESENAVISERERAVEKNVTSRKAVEVKEHLEFSKVEKALKEETSAIVQTQEMELAQDEVNKTEELEMQNVSVKTFPLTEKTEEAVNLQVAGKPDKTLDVEISSSKEKATASGQVPSGIEKVTEEKTTGFREEGAKVTVSEEARVTAEETTSPALPETDTEAFSKTVSDNELIPSEEGFKEETIHVEDERGSVAEILTSEKNKIPSMAELKPGIKKQTGIGEQKPLLGIPIPETLFLKDIKIEVFLRRFSSEIPAPAASEQPQLPKATEIINISCEKSADIVEVLIKGNGSMTPHVFPADNNRIVIDIPDVVLNAPLPSAVVSHLKRIRSGKHKDKIRLVLDLREKMDFDVLSTRDSITITVHKLGKKLSLPIEAQKPEEKIEAVELKEIEMPNVLLQLLKKAHPMANRKNGSKKQQEVAVVEGKEETHVEGTIGVMRLFSVAEVEKGIYTFIIKNKGEEPYEADVVFRLFEGKAGERIKEFRTIGLSPNAVLQFKFVLPEAVFWDDEDYFTGTLEDSYTLTKFNDKTGLIWKEEKDY